MVGLTVGDKLEETNVPPHDPEYQNQLAPGPRLPPLKLSVELVGEVEQIDDGVAVTDVAGAEPNNCDNGLLHMPV